MAKQTDHSETHDLEEFRAERKLSYGDLAELIGVRQAKQARTYALGHAWPRSEQLEVIIEKTKGAVSIEAMHRRRMAFLAAEEAKAKPARLSRSHRSERRVA